MPSATPGSHLVTSKPGGFTADGKQDLCKDRMLYPRLSLLGSLTEPGAEKETDDIVHMHTGSRELPLLPDPPSETARMIIRLAEGRTYNRASRGLDWR